MSPADWVVAGVRPFRDNRVTSLVPQGFAAYARVFHPALDAAGAPVSWRAVAEANGRQAHAGMEWVGITGSWVYVNSRSQPGLWDYSPDEGSMPAPLAAALGDVLRQHTGSLRWWYAVWEGFPHCPWQQAAVPRVPMAARPMVLGAGGPDDAVLSFAPAPWHQSASLWWPDDRVWCVATDVDLMTTYVGGSRDVVDDVLADARLEAFEVSPEQTLAWTTDTLNPPPAGRP